MNFKWKRGAARKTVFDYVIFLLDRINLPASPVFWIALAVAVIWSSIATHLYQERVGSLRAATETTGNLARGFGENVGRTVAGVDQIIKVLRNAYTANPAGFDLPKLAPADQILDSATVQIGATDRYGKLTASNLPYTKGLDFSDRKHIKIQMEGATDSLYISVPLIGRVSNRWSLQFSRKMFAPDGTVAGVLVVSLDPDYFSQFYRTLDIGQGSVTLIGIGDGIVRAHKPSVADDIGHSANDLLLQRIRNDQTSGIFQAQDQFDGVSRISSYRRLDGYGVAVVVGLATDEVFAQFQADLRIYATIGLCKTLLVVVLGVTLWRQKRRQITSQAQLTAIMETIDQGIMMIDPQGRTPVLNRRAIELLGLPPQLVTNDLRHADIVKWQVANGEFSAADAAAFRTMLDVPAEAGVFVRGTGPTPGTYERSRPNGIILEVGIHPMRGGGAVRSFTDVTARRQAEQDLQRAQIRLGQAKRMEAIGHLTGGIAHDFNNLLAVVVCNLDMLIEETQAGSEPRLMVTGALSAAMRGSTLVSQLLAFARKLPLAPQTIDINQLTTGMVSLLDRTLGGAIVLTLRKDPTLWPVTVDSTQLESAILNLAINARDAMPAGGILQLETRCVTLGTAEIAEMPDASAGDYVLLSMTDTGTGMLPEVLARVFDPFFSTKAEGKGTGLGLSMVYGFTHQSGGHVLINSTPGVGTTVQLYLPRCLDAHVSASLPTARNASLPRGHEVILLVDDNCGVRESAARILASLGYVVLEAESGEQALEILACTPMLDLLLTDVIMPGGIDGRTLACMATASRPELVVLLTSGHADTTSDACNLETSEWDLLSKPYRLQELATRVRNALNKHKVQEGEKAVLLRVW